MFDPRRSPFAIENLTINGIDELENADEVKTALREYLQTHPEKHITFDGCACNDKFPLTEDQLDSTIIVERNVSFDEELW